MNHTPDEKQMEEFLERAAPATTGQLEKRLASAPWTVGVVSRRRYINLSAFAVLVFSLAFASTPQGSALAQEILLFFTRAESDSYYEPVSDLTFEETTAFHELCGTAIQPTCSVEQIRGMVNFEVKELASFPDDLFYVGATGGPDWVSLKYEYPDRLAGGIGIIVEARTEKYIVAKSADVKQLQVGDFPAEYYTGILFQDDNGNVTWLPDEPVAQLRWVDGDSTYTFIYVFQNQEDPLTMEELIALAEGMTLEPVAK